jgi:hypothetical protein
MRDEPKLKGRKLSRKIGKGRTVEDALNMALAKVVDGWPRTREANRRLYGLELPDNHTAILSRLQIEIDLLQDLAEVTDKSLRRMRWSYELGIHGMGIETPANFYYLEPSYAVHRERKSVNQFLIKLLSRNGLTRYLTNASDDTRVNVSTWFSDRNFQLKRFNTISWIESPDQKVTPLYRGVPLVPISSISKPSILHSLRLGAQWLRTNQHPDGQYAYKYQPLNKPERRWYPGGNIVRHALNPYSLLLVHSLSPDPDLIASAKRGIDFTLSFLRKSGSRCVVCHRDPPARYYNAKIGTNAVTLLALLKLAEIEDIAPYRNALDCLAQELLYVQDPNGHFRQFDVPKEHPYYGAESTIAPGEIILALARMYAFTKDRSYLRAAEMAVPYYLKQWRHMVSQKTGDGIYNEENRVNIVGIIPWMVMAFDDLHRETGKTEYVELAFEMQRWIDREIFYSLSRSAYPDYIGAAFKTHKELPAINACQFTEGSSSAYNIAKRAQLDVVRRREILLLGARFCLQLQYTDYPSTFFVPVPNEVLGGYRYHLGALRLRNDYSYHAISALAQTAMYLKETDYSFLSAIEKRIPSYLHPPEHPF